MSRHPLLRSLFVPASLLFCLGIASAQTKVGVINVQRAVLETAEIKKASAGLEAKYKPRQAEMEKVRLELEGVQQKIQAGRLSPQQQADLTAQGQRRQRDLQRMGEDLQAEVEAERNEILSKSSQRMQEVVKKVAEEKGLDLVVDVTNAVFFKPALEITNDAITAYDKAYPPK
jgi:outer membrane protein